MDPRVDLCQGATRFGAKEAETTSIPVGRLAFKHFTLHVGEIFEGTKAAIDVTYRPEEVIQRQRWEGNYEDQVLCRNMTNYYT